MIKMTEEVTTNLLEFARDNMTSLEALEAIKDWVKCFVRFDRMPVEFEIIERDLKKLEEVKKWVKSFEYQRP